MSTITNKTITQTVTLGSVNYASPLTITSTGAIETSGFAVYGPGTAAWTVENDGTIRSTASNGIDLKQGGSVKNAGLIAGYAGGVEIYGTVGTVSNSGTIIGTDRLAHGLDGVGSGIALNLGGSVDNTGLIQGYGNGVYIYNAAGTVTNSGTIRATYYPGVHLANGGSVDNSFLIVGYVGVLLVGAPGTLTNYGTIEATGTGTSTPGVDIRTGGVFNGLPGYIQGNTGVYAVSGTVDNLGTIKGTGTKTGGFGVNMIGGGQLTNTGQITGYVGVGITGAFNNLGTIKGTGTSTGGFGARLIAGGNVSNTGTGYIAGYVGVGITGAAGTVANSGTIRGTIGFGVQFLLGGSLGNSGLINGGVGVAGAAGTVTNSATIVQTGTGAGWGVVLFAGGTVSNIRHRLYRGIHRRRSLRRRRHAGQYLRPIKGTGTGTSSYGVELLAGGSVSNTGQTGSVAGQTGVEITGGTGSIVNFGTIEGAGTVTGSFGTELKAGGDVHNSGSIAGRTAVYITGGTGTVVNVSEINAAGTSTGSFGVELKAGGYVENADIITGFTGIYITGAAGTVNNYNTVTATIGKYSIGVQLGKGGSVGNEGLIKGSSGVIINGGSGSLTNSATILGTGTAFSSVGVALLAGGRVSNDVYGLIEARTGVESAGLGNTGTVTNFGTIIGTALDGVILTGGSVANNAGPIHVGLIQGYDGVVIDGAAGAVTNSATIRGVGLGGIGVYLAPASSAYTDSVLNTASGLIVGGTGVAITGGPGTVTNSGKITGTAGTGVNLAAGGTIFDAGTIIGGNGTDISFGGIGANLLVLQSGYYSYGLIVGGTSATNTVQLAGSAGAPVTAYYGFTGFGLTNFQHVGFGGNVTLKVGQTIGTLGATISGFSLASDIIDLTSISSGTIIGGTPNNLDQLVVSNGAQTVTLQLDPSDGTQFTTSPDVSGGTDITPACFGRGTRILTDRGEVAVEDLAIGDRAVTFSGAARALKWIGRRAYDGRFIAANRGVLPIRVEAGAISDGVPARDLFLSPEHALYIDGVLAPAGLLTNGATIRQVADIERLEYFHVELDSHDVIMAEGAAAETYVDCDNRFMFQNGGEFAARYPDDRPVTWNFCAERAEAGSDELTAIRAALLERAEWLGHTLDLDPDLHLIVDGEIVRPESADARLYRFAIPAGSTEVWLASRRAVPAEIEAGSRDIRRLGVAVERIVLYDRDLSIEAWHGLATLCEGFHEDEAAHRWTDGMARLAETWLRPFPGPLTLEVYLASCELTYWLPASGLAEAALRA